MRRDQSLSQSFPAPRRTNKESKSPQISFSPDDMSTPRQFGSNYLKKPTQFAKHIFMQKSVQEVVGETTRSRLVLKPTSTKWLSQKRQILCEIMNIMSNEMNGKGDTLVLQNRLSWSRFDSVRKSQDLSGAQRKKPTNENDEDPTTKRKHGCNAAKLTCMIDKDELLHEAHLWEPDKQVNWSQLGQRYGLSMPNCGHVIKEYLAEQGIPAAQINQCKYKSHRRSKKGLPGGKVSFLMYKPVEKLKERVTENIQSGEIQIGKEVVQTTYPKYATHQGEFTQEIVEITARKIPPLDIREKLLKRHEQLGIMQSDPDDYFATLPEEAVKARFTKLHETIEAVLTYLSASF